MSADDTNQGGKPFHYEGGIPVFEARLDKVERKATEAETRDEEYKNRQVGINFRMMVFTGLLVLTSLITGGISIWQATIANTSAQAAKSSAKTATDALKEIQNSATDTHELAVQAKNQADRTKDVADRALFQANATNRLATEAKRQADIAREAMNATIESAKQDRRPWVGLQLLQCNNCRTETDGSLVIGDLSAMLVNTGKTPAIDMTVRWTFESIKASAPIPTYDAIERENEAALKRERTIPPNFPPDIAADIAKTMAVVERDITPPKEVLAPDAARGITIIVGLKQARDRMLRREDSNVVYGLGKVTYYDTSHTVQHTTMFCVMNNFGTSFRYCPTGNTMD